MDRPRPTVTDPSGLGGTRFTRAGSARVLTPDAPGLAALIAAVDAGRTISAGAGPDPDGATQWLITRTAGSSGRAKTIRRSPASWIASFEVNRGLFDLTPADTYAVLSGLEHSLALYGCLEALHLGCGLALLAGLSPKAAGRAMALHGVTMLYATPVQLGLLVRAGARLPSVRHVAVGGGPLGSALRASSQAVFPNAEIRVFYGTSETSFVTLGDVDTPDGCVGRPYPGVDLSLGPEGEVWVRSPYLCDGYLEPDAALRRDAGAIGTGEIGAVDRDGNLRILGRRDRMLTIHDQSLHPEAVEEVLARATGRPVAVLPDEDPGRGLGVCAVIEGPPCPEATLRAACRAALGPHAVPRRVVFVEALPLLAAGKPDLSRLAQMVAR